MSAKEIYDDLRKQGFDDQQIADAACDGEWLGNEGIDEKTAGDLLDIAKQKHMIIKSSEINATDIKGIIAELESRSDVMDFIRGHNLRGGDFLEAVASKIAYDDEDADLSEIAKLCK